MIQDIFVPSKIGSYYIFPKRVLSFEVTTSFVQASLIFFSKTNIMIENSIKISLQDNNHAAIINAIKKISTTIGKYDEIVTSLPSSALVFKELVLPFIGREKIKMIVNYEVEPLLPFSLDEAVIDFLVTDEDKEKSQTTILVAAARASDLDAYTSYFEKAGVSLTSVSIDMFALYDFYRYFMYVAQAYTSLLLVDFGVDAIRVVYIQKGVLQSVRLIPSGLAAMLGKVDGNLHGALSLDALLEQDAAFQHKITQQLVVEFSKQMSLSVSFFQKQVKNFIAPAKIICLGAGTQLNGFLDEAMHVCTIPVEVLDIKKVLHKNNIQVHKTIKINNQLSTSLIIPLATAYDENINFLSHKQNKIESRLFHKQLLTVLFLSVATLASLYFYSNYQLQQWNSAYNISRKNMIHTLEEQLDLDVKNVKRVGDILNAAQSKLDQAKKVCFSFSQSNNAFLNHLQELCSKIDRISLGLDLKKMSLHDKEVVLQGKVKDFDALQIFEEELMELPSFTIKDRPRELAFTVTLLLKNDQEDK